MSDSTAATRPQSPQASAPGAPSRLWQRLGRSHLRAALGAALGAGIGAAYAHFIGCRTGTCPITSNVWVAAFYGGSVGALVGWPGRQTPPKDARQVP